MTVSEVLLSSSGFWKFTSGLTTELYSGSVVSCEYPVLGNGAAYSTSRSTSTIFGVPSTYTNGAMQANSITGGSFTILVSNVLNPTDHNSPAHVPASLTFTDRTASTLMTAGEEGNTTTSSVSLTTGQFSIISTTISTTVATVMVPTDTGTLATSSTLSYSVTLPQYSGMASRAFPNSITVFVMLVYLLI